MFCSECGKEINSTSKFCSECGKEINSKDSNLQDISKPYESNDKPKKERKNLSAFEQAKLSADKTRNPEKNKKHKKQTLEEAKIEFVLEGWKIELEEEKRFVASKEKKVNHILHAILTVLTGIWAIVWIVLYLRKKVDRRVVSFEEKTNSIMIRNN